MNIAFVSPHTNKTGVSSVTILIALELGKKAKKVCIIHTSSEPVGITKYLGLSEAFKDDKTNNPSRLVKMINDGAVKPEEIHDYCKIVADNVEAFTSDGKLTDDELFSVIQFTMQSNAFDYVLVDVDAESMQSKVNNDTLEMCHCAAIVLNQNIIELNEFNRNNTKILRYLRKLPSIVIVNKYCSIASSIKDTAAMLGVKKPNNWLTLRFNAWIGWACNNGKMTELSECISDAEDVRVVDIAADLKNILNMILKIKIAVRKEKIEGKQ